MNPSSFLRGCPRVDKNMFTSARLYRPFREGEIAIRVQFMLYILTITRETQRANLIFTLNMAKK